MNYIDHKFLSLLLPYLTGCKRTHEDVYNFRCPLCGDSEKSTTKMRGYLFKYKDAFMFKCHNCGAACGLSSLIRTIAPSLYSEYIFEKFRENDDLSRPSDTDSQFRTATSFQTDLATKFRRCSNRLGLARIESAAVARDYLVKRRIPESYFDRFLYCENVNLVAAELDQYKDWKMPPKPALAIPFWDLKDNLTHVQFRFFDGGIRYITFKIIEDRLPIWGLGNVDRSKEIMVTEGAFDACFVDNCVAVTGSEVLIRVCEHLRAAGCSPVIIPDSDYRTNRYVWETAREAIQKKFGIVLVDDEFSAKDINDQILRGWSRLRLNLYLKTRLFRGLRAELEFAKIRKP